MATDTRPKGGPADAEPAHRPAERTHGVRDEQRDWDRPSFNPFSIMRQGIDEMERLVGHLGRGRAWGPATAWASTGRDLMSQLGRQMGDWSPAIDAFQRGNEFVIRAEVPGMNRQDLTVEIADDSVTLHGQRKREFEQDRENVLCTERSYGTFTRVIPLPPGAIGDSAKATFSNGMLEIVLQAPSAEARRGRKIDISGTNEPDRKSA